MSAGNEKRARGREKSGASALSALRARFRNPELLELALTHPSLAPEPGHNYERLEFLGDAVLGIVVAEQLYRRFPTLNEGALSKFKAAVVSSKGLVDVARRYELVEAARLHDSAQATLGRSRKNLGPDLVESVIGARYLDAGFDAAQELILEMLAPVLESLDPEMVPGGSDYKSRFQERVQGALHIKPTYALVGEEGPAHARTFTAEVRVGGEPWGQGVGNSRKSAEQSAAREAMRVLESGERVLQK